MMKVKNLDIIKLQTKHMQQDETTQALSAALTPEFRKLSEEVKQCLLLARVEELSEALLDALAWELHVKWYDATAAIEVKRNLIKNSDKVHMHLGTPYAVEQVIEDYFGDGYVEEWFNYDGEPYKFRVVTTNASVTTDLANQFTMAVETVKNKRSKLEQIIIALSGELNTYLTAVVHTGDILTIEQVV